MSGSTQDITLLRKVVPMANIDLLLEQIDSLYRYALVLARNRSDAEDLVQETCVRALSAITRLNENSNVKSWMFTILRSMWLNRVRAIRAARQVYGVDLDQYLPDMHTGILKDPHFLFQSKEDQDRVGHAIEQLPTAFREVILLREFEELSYENIANILDCPIGTVMSRLGRARAKLREFLGVREVVGPDSASRDLGK
jgi:RNA polymerase sigma-70 factor (ECF subfamily)